MIHVNLPRTKSVPAISALALMVASVLYAGPLDPPAGPVNSTYKTLSEVEPRIAINATNTPGDNDSLFRISQPGSYYLAGNIIGTFGKHGIEIAASGVTIDLNGFDIAGLQPALDGVSVTSANLRNIMVVNGSIRNWGDQGIDFGTFAATNCRVERVSASGNFGTGIFVGNETTINNCSAILNEGNGLGLGSNCIVNNCLASGNLSNGIASSVNCAITSCLVSGNAVAGINTGNGSTIAHCTSRDNGENGFFGNTGCTFLNSSAVGNNGNGIATTSGSTVTGCTARGNSLNGISVTTGNNVRENACSDNGSAGSDGANIYVAGTDNRIEGNTCSGADRGIEVAGAGNFIIRNTCSGNALNWFIAASNICGPIVDRSAPNSAAISGNSAPSSLGSGEANANFTH